MKPETPLPSPFPRAFTLIELLIVVAIIAILAAIAVPNFLEAQTRARVSRVKNDMRALVTAIEAYTVDNNAPPIRHNIIQASMKPSVPEVGNRLEQMSVLTTPIAYITSLPVDVFETTIPPPNDVIDYWDPTQASWLVNSRYTINDPRRVIPGEIGYLVVSVGPDGYMGPVSGNLYGWPRPYGNALDYLGTVYVVYDPTNGMLSKGNIYDSGRGLDGTPPYLMEHFGL